MKNLKTFESFVMQRDNCDRCGGTTKNTTTTSMFNMDVICRNCKEEEQKDPEYEAASKAELEAIRKGVKNYQGAMPDYEPLKRS